MQTSQTAASPLSVLLFIAVIYLVVKSPKNLQTLGRMMIALLITVLLIIVPGTILRIGDPRAWGQLAGLAGLLMAVIASWWHIRSVKRASTEVPGQPPSKN